MGFLSNFFKGTKDKWEQKQLFTPQQQAFMDAMMAGAQPGLESGLGYLSSLLGGGQEATQAFEAPLMRQFQEQTIPALAERFAGLDAQGSSAFGQSLGQAGAGLAENLAALREGLKMQAIGQLSQLGGMGLGQRYENILRPGRPGALGGILGGLAGGIGAGLGAGMGGSMFGGGAAAGGAGMGGGAMAPGMLV